jgi:UDP-3-O-[3-hydroxymyristoyl] N-acetylglucosamine deacetylase
MPHVSPLEGAGITLEGVGLRSGRPASVVLRRHRLPFAFAVGDVVTPRSALVVTDGERATTVRAGDDTIATVEHLLAACAALGLHEGLVVEVRGGEVPLLDGAARAFVTALDRLDLAPTPPALTVVRDDTLTHGSSRYTFRRGDATRVSVTLTYDDARMTADAAWDGSREDFVARIAAARTFAFAHEVAALVEQGHASHVDPASVIVFTPDAVLTSGAFVSDEPARHKLLDLMGDLFLYGGPPRGSVHALCPGHRATHAIVREALASGVIA